MSPKRISFCTSSNTVIPENDTVLAINGILVGLLGLIDEIYYLSDRKHLCP